MNLSAFLLPDISEFLRKNAGIRKESAATRDVRIWPDSEEIHLLGRVSLK